MLKLPLSPLPRPESNVYVNISPTSTSFDVNIPTIVPGACLSIISVDVMPIFVGGLFPGMTIGVGIIVPVGVGIGVAVPVGVGVSIGVGIGVDVGLGVGVAVGLDVAVGVAVGALARLNIQSST